MMTTPETRLTPGEKRSYWLGVLIGFVGTSIGFALGHWLFV